jgi:two-component system sensor histidine kinase KdpD
MADKAAVFLNMIRRDRRGRLKVYLGYAAGVGKTYQMLLEGHRLKQEGIDVVIGVVETHGRKETERLVEGLEAVPRRKIDYHGISVEEMDLDAVLSRRPKVVLVDELAHTNAPGVRNTKRYQDVEDLLDAGINVIATLNVQHLESLFDTVERMMGVKVRERVPDSILAEADQVVNVDLSAEDLHKRLKAGKIYPLDRVKTALENFFQNHHLEQLRELTLREAASQIDFRRREAEGQSVKGAVDQVMVCLDARGPENAALLRYGSRLAGRLNRNWYAVYVQSLNEGPTVIDALRQRMLAETLTLANQLGATVFTLKGEDIADTLARFAAEYRVGHIILGKPHRRPFWNRFFRREDVAGGLMRRTSGTTLILIDTRAGASTPEAEEAPEHAAATAADGGRQAERLRLSDHLDAGGIRIWEESITKDQAMRELLRAIVSANPHLDEEALLKSLQDREKQGSTFLNEGVALPHARVAGIDRPYAALGISHGGILDAYTENPIEAVFLLLSPVDGHRSHLQLLSVVGRMMLNRTLRGRLRKERDGEDIRRILADFEAAREAPEERGRAQGQADAPVGPVFK